jgi:hypothetical protein
MKEEGTEAVKESLLILPTKRLIQMPTTTYRLQTQPNENKETNNLELVKKDVL